MIDAQLTLEGLNQLKLRSARIKLAQPILEEVVLDIIPQISPRNLLASRIRFERLARDVVDVRESLVARLDQRSDIGRRDRVRPPSPERIHERQTGRRCPQLSEIDLLHVGRPMIEKQRVVADD